MLDFRQEQHVGCEVCDSTSHIASHLDRHFTGHTKRMQMVQMSWLC